MSRAHGCARATLAALLRTFKQLDLWWCSAWGRLSSFVGNSLLLKMFKDLLDNRWVFHAGDDMQGRINAVGAGTRRSGDLDWTLAFLTDFDIDVA